MYWFILIIILFLTYLEVKNRRINKSAFNLIYLLLIILVVLRNGQGSDYYNYKELYKEIAFATEKSILPLFLIKDPGFAFLNYIFIQSGASYEFFSAFVSFLIMAILFKYFAKVCHKSMIPVFFFYSTYYLIYPFSALRQGLAMAVLLSIVFPLLRGNKRIKCAIVIVITSLFHQSFLICLLLLVVYRITIRTRILLFLSLPFIFNLILGINVMELIPISTVVERTQYYLEGGATNSMLAIIVRVIVLIPLFLISDQLYSRNSEIIGIRNILFCGFVIYSIFSFSDLISSRLTVYFRAFEGLFVLYLLYNTNLKKISHQILSYYVVISLVLFAKNIDGFIVQGEYENCNIFTYPYFSVFDDENTIMYYRKNLGFADSLE